MREGHDIGAAMWCGSCLRRPCRYYSEAEVVTAAALEPPFAAGDLVRTRRIGRHRRWSQRLGTVLECRHTRQGWVVVVRWPDHGTTTHFDTHLELRSRS